MITLCFRLLLVVFITFYLHAIFFNIRNIWWIKIDILTLISMNSKNLNVLVQYHLDISPFKNSVNEIRMLYCTKNILRGWLFITGLFMVIWLLCVLFFKLYQRHDNMTCCELRNQNKTFAFFVFNATKLFFPNHRKGLDSACVDRIIFMYTYSKYIKDTTTLFVVKCPLP